MSITIRQPHLCTKLIIWSPRYSSQYGELGEPVVLLSKSKVHHASPVILIEFTQAKHLKGQRFAIKREDAQKYPEESNGKIPCLAIPLSAFQSWDSVQEIRDTIDSFGW